MLALYVTILLSNVDFSSDRLRRAYVDELITLELPAGDTICDFGTYTLWCKAARVFFTLIKVPSHIHDSFGCGATTTQPSTTPTPTPVTPTRPSCTGQLVGSLPNLAHGVSGMLYAVDKTTICISGFHYDGTGPGENVVSHHLSEF